MEDGFIFVDTIPPPTSFEMIPPTIEINEVSNNSTTCDQIAKLGNCKIGDQVSCSRVGGLYSHHGVLIDNESVYHVNAGPFSGIHVCMGLENALVRVDSVDRFLKGNTKLSLVSRGSPTTDVNKLRLQNGERVPYNIVFNNCEHYASRAIGDSHPRSVQTEKVMMVVLTGATLVVSPISLPMALGIFSVVTGGIMYT